MDSIYQRLKHLVFGTKADYEVRKEPQTVADPLTATDSTTYPPDVYRFAGFLAKHFGCRSIIDLGCGANQDLTQVPSDLTFIRVGSGDNLCRVPQTHPGAIIMEHDFAGGALHIADRELVRQSLIVCSNIIERLPDPLPLLASLQDLLADAQAAILTTTVRDVLYSSQHASPSDNVSDGRARSLPEFEALLRGAGLNIDLAGLTASNDSDWAKRTMLAVLRHRGTEQQLSTPRDFRVLAFMCTYNEEDIVQTVLKHVISQGVQVHLVDNWSTDRTVERAEEFLGRGLTRITKYPIEGPSPTYDWHALLTHVEELSSACDADWCIHYDADEIRESPWPDIKSSRRIVPCRLRRLQRGRPHLSGIPSDPGWN